ncbi:hypothetical protein Goklo_026397, partial [Gossypium klotzschianum]|nr:hypothetical protein [Gossypium klotzschianum]
MAMDVKPISDQVKGKAKVTLKE